VRRRAYYSRDAPGFPRTPLKRLLALGHVTFDRTPGGDVLGGSVSYAALTAQRLGWNAAVLTVAGHDFDPARELPGIECFLTRGAATTRFQNVHAAEGQREQHLLARAADVSPELLPDAWRAPEVLLLAPVAGELGPGLVERFEAEVVGAIAQGFVRGTDVNGKVRPIPWADPRGDLAGVHVLFLSEHDLAFPEREIEALQELVPIVALTRGWRGLTLVTREARYEVPSLPREERDPTGAGDVFAAAFLLRYHESLDPLEAAAFAACAASCAVEGPGTSTLGDRDEVLRRLVLRERLLEDGEWEE
jgi:sugar/nucleoside kinase (ribokinase family)